MTGEDHPLSQSNQPTLRSAVLFRFKVSLLQLNRGLHDLIDPEIKRHPISESLAAGNLAAVSSTPLWTDLDAAEKSMQLGKVHNLRLAVKRLNGVEVPANTIFSFWAHVGKATRLRGFVAGRELREGCIIPTVGGGLCQLSNAIYDAALQANLEIVERHAHSQVVPGSLAERGRDATIFWNYVDLRIRGEQAFRIEAKLDGESLTVSIRRKEDKPRKLLQIVAAEVTSSESPGAEEHHPNSCMTCGVTECFRNVKPAKVAFQTTTAFLVDEYWPEFDRYISSERNSEDILYLPLNGAKLGKSNYAWSTEGFAKVKTSPAQTVIRAIESRKLAQQGAARQAALLNHLRRLAASYASRLTHDVAHVTVTQGLLPFLWMDGVLGGRTFDVLLTQLPMKVLHERLDFGHHLHPESSTLADFRANPLIVAAETEALRQARRVVTPHRDIASLFPQNVELLDWSLPERVHQKRGSAIIFPSATLARKGAYEARAMLKQLNLPVITAGPQLEGSHFWNGIECSEASGQDWLNNASLVVLPAFVEHKPRRLLQALSRGIPVVASRECGLGDREGVITVNAGNTTALIEAVTMVQKRDSNEKGSVCDQTPPWSYAPP